MTPHDALDVPAAFVAAFNSRDDDALARVYARLVATADSVKTIDDAHIIAAVAAVRTTEELRQCV